MASEHTAKAFDSDLQELTRLVAEMGGLAERMIVDSVDALIRRDVALGIAPGQRLDRVGNLLLGQTTHFRDHAGDVLQIDIESLGSMFAHCDCHYRQSPVDHPNRPVT